MGHIYKLVLLSSSRFNLYLILLYSSFMDTITRYLICISQRAEESRLIFCFRVRPANQIRKSKEIIFSVSEFRIFTAFKKIKFSRYKQLYQLPRQQTILLDEMLFDCLNPYSKSRKMQQSSQMKLVYPQKLIQMICRAKYSCNDTHYGRNFGFKPEIVW